MSLATRAFGDLPENHMYQQEVVRFCQGAADKEAGSYASNIRPKNIEEAIDEMRWHQHNHQAIYGRPPRTEVKQVSPGSYNGEERDGEIKSNLAALSAQMAVMMEEVKKRGKGSAKGEKQVSFQENKEALNYKGATREA